MTRHRPLPAGPLAARHNPFATERLHALGYRDPATGEPVDCAALLERFDRLGRRCVVVGPEGSGKTALLEALAPHLPARGLEPRWVRGRPGGRGLDGDLASAAAGSKTVLLVDGADRLPRRRRLEILRAGRRAGGLLATSHRPGVLPTLARCSTSPALLKRLVAELVGSAPERPLPEPGALHERHAGNLRLAFLELYDLYAGR